VACSLTSKTKIEGKTALEVGSRLSRLRSQLHRQTALAFR